MPMYRRHPFSRHRCLSNFPLLYTIAIICTFHVAVVAYSSSAYMEQFATPEVIGALYTIGSALAVICFLFISRVLRWVGNVLLTVWLSLVAAASLILIGTAFSPALAIVAFVVYLFVTPLLYLNIDIFAETMIGSAEEKTGSIRGLALTLMSLATAAGPLVMGLLVGDDDSRLSLSFFLSAFTLLVFVVIILIHFRTFCDPLYKELRVLEAVRSFWVNTNMRFTMFAHFLLQMFFSWTIIFIPLYMATEVGLSWDVLGGILAFGLLAYVIVEYPAGILADKYLGEKEMMAVGFVILAVTVSWISFMDGAPVLSWMMLMFINRVGAALVEVSNESYFFKHTVGSDVNVISFFRLIRPLASIAGALFGSAALLFMPFKLIFILFGLSMVPGVFFASRLVDTK